MLTTVFVVVLDGLCFFKLYFSNLFMTKRKVTFTRCSTNFRPVGGRSARARRVTAVFAGDSTGWKKLTPHILFTQNSQFNMFTLFTKTNCQTRWNFNFCQRFYHLPCAVGYFSKYPSAEWSRFMKPRLLRTGNSGVHTASLNFSTVPAKNDLKSALNFWLTKRLNYRTVGGVSETSERINFQAVKSSSGYKFWL